MAGVNPQRPERDPSRTQRSDITRRRIRRCGRRRGAAPEVLVAGDGGAGGGGVGGAPLLDGVYAVVEEEVHVAVGVDDADEAAGEVVEVALAVVLGRSVDGGELLPSVEFELGEGVLGRGEFGDVAVVVVGDSGAGEGGVTGGGEVLLADGEFHS